jgi:hypothetical protein
MLFLAPPGFTADLTAAAPVYPSGKRSNDALDAALKIVEKGPSVLLVENSRKGRGNTCFPTFNWRVMTAFPVKLPQNPH